MENLYGIPVFKSNLIREWPRMPRGKKNRYLARFLGRAAGCKFGGYAIWDGAVYVKPRSTKIKAK